MPLSLDLPDIRTAHCQSSSNFPCNLSPRNGSEVMTSCPYLIQHNPDQIPQIGSMHACVLPLFTRQW